jgi:serine/threonine-protein kinase
MITTRVSPAEAFLADLAEHVPTPAALERARAFRQAFPNRGAEELATFLVEQKLLTRFQADVLLKGEGSKLVLSIFSLVDVIGTGSMGTVYKARAMKDSEWYAIKIVPRRNVVNLATIGEKVEALKEIRHPRISAMIHVGAQGERVYMVWPLLEGGDKLDNIVQSKGKLTPKAAAQVALQIGLGLEAYHKHGLFHGLLKASDVLIGADRRVRLLDFGVGFLLTCERGKALLDTTTNNRALARGIDCASPESIMDPLNRTTQGDQYSLGCILYFCLTGRYPFVDSNPVKKMLAHQFEEPTPVTDLVPDCPPRLARIVHRMLSKQPADRFEDIGVVVAELQGVTSDTHVGVPTVAAAASRPSTPIPAPAIVPSARATTMKKEGPRPEPARKQPAQQKSKQKAKEKAKQKAKQPVPKQPVPKQPVPKQPVPKQPVPKQPVPSRGRAGWWLTLAAAAIGSAVGIATWVLMNR